MPRKTFMLMRLFCIVLLSLTSFAVPAQTQQHPEYLWYEAENMRGFTTGKIGEPILNPSYLNLGRDKVPGWGINGPGVSAEWTQGGESEWNSAAASADENKATLYQDLEIPREGKSFLFTKVLNIGNTPLSINARMMSQHRFQMLQMTWQVAAFLLGLAVWWLQWRSRRNSFVS